MYISSFPDGSLAATTLQQDAGSHSRSSLNLGSTGRPDGVIGQQRYDVFRIAALEPFFMYANGQDNTVGPSLSIESTGQSSLLHLVESL